MRLTDYVIIGLVAVIVLLIVFDKDPQQDTTQWKNAVASAEDRANVAEAKLVIKGAAFDSLVSASKDKAKGDSIKLSAMGKENRQLKKKAAEMEALIPEAEKTQAVTQALQAKDEVINKQDQEIDSLKSSLSFQIKVVDELSKIKIDSDKFIKEMREASEERFQAQVKLTEAAMKDNKKLRRTVKIIKVVAVIGTVTGIFLGGR